MRRSRAVAKIGDDAEQPLTFLELYLAVAHFSHASAPAPSGGVLGERPSSTREQCASASRSRPGEPVVISSSSAWPHRLPERDLPPLPHPPAVLGSATLEVAESRDFPGGSVDAGSGPSSMAATHGLPAVYDIQLAPIESDVVSVRWVCQTACAGAT
jgi:hypothetical protein